MFGCGVGRAVSFMAKPSCSSWLIVPQSSSRARALRILLRLLLLASALLHKAPRLCLDALERAVAYASIAKRDERLVAGQHVHRIQEEFDVVESGVDWRGLADLEEVVGNEVEIRNHDDVRGCACRRGCVPASLPARLGDRAGSLRPDVCREHVPTPVGLVSL